MMRKIRIPLILSAVLLTSCANESPGQVEFEVDGDKQEVRVTIGGEPFTTYRHGPILEKPVLYPVYAAGGTVVTRGFPIAPRRKERVDHPHQVGLWFSFGDVNGFDFWNNSFAVPAERKMNYGRIVHREILRTESEKGKGILEVRSDWVAPDNQDGAVLLIEQTSFIFQQRGEVRIIDRITRLTSAADTVVFTDNKEGLMAIRVDRAFELPSDEPVVLTDDAGNPSGGPAVDREGVSGWYRNSEGIEGNQAWGKRAEWVKLSGTKGGKTLSMILVDHPLNPGYPSCWHARDYGLFSVNNMGRRVFDSNLEPFMMVLKKGESVTLRHRFVVAPGDLSDAEIKLLALDFTED